MHSPSMYLGSMGAFAYSLLEVTMSTNFRVLFFYSLREIEGSVELYDLFQIRSWTNLAEICFLILVLEGSELKLDAATHDFSPYTSTVLS